MSLKNYGLHNMTIGIKFIPLRTPGGELIPGSGLFVKIKKTAATTSTTEMSGRRGKISRQDALDHNNGDDYTKEERESCAAERRTDVESLREQRRQKLIIVNSQAVESSLSTSTVDPSLNTSNPQQTVTVEVHRDTSWLKHVILYYN